MELTLEGFEGSIELLYELVKKSIIDISGISLAQIADKIIDYLRAPALDLNLASHYLYLLSLLMAIKLSLLLPSAVVPDENLAEREEGDFSWVERVKNKIEQTYTERLRFVHHSRERNFPFDIEVESDLSLLVDAYFSILRREATKKTLEEKIQSKDFSIVKERVLRDIDSRGKLTLRDLIFLSQDVEEAVFSFFLLMELLSKGEIIAIQEQPFSQIYIWTREAFEDELERAESPS